MKASEYNPSRSPATWDFEVCPASDKFKVDNRSWKVYPSLQVSVFWGGGVRVELYPCHTHVIANIAIGPAVVGVHVHPFDNQMSKYNKQYSYSLVTWLGRFGTV